MGLKPVRITQLGQSSAIGIGAVTTAPSKGTVAEDSVIYGYEGQFMIAFFKFRKTASGSDGSGNYLISLPGGKSADINIISPENGTLVYTNFGKGVIDSHFQWNTGAGAPSRATAILYSATQFRLLLERIDTSSVSVFGSGATGMGSNTTLFFQGWIKIPIQGR